MQSHYALLSKDLAVKPLKKSGLVDKTLTIEQIEIFSEVVLLCQSFIAQEYGLSAASTHMLLKAFGVLKREKFIKKCRFRAMFGLTSSEGDINSSLRPFFLFDETKGFTLSALGLSAYDLWGATLRRVVQNPDEYYRLKYKRILPEEKAKRRAKQRFWKLSESEQIAVLREYYALPYRNDAEKLVRKKKRLEIFNLYDLVNRDLMNAIEKHAHQVKSVRMQPHLVGIFPVWSGRGRGKPKRVPTQDPEIPST